MNNVDRIALLESFVRVIDVGSLSAAATSMDITQPTISRRIKALESIVGTKLIHRTTHYLELTDEGRRFLPQARDLVSRWDAGLDDLKDNEPQGLLRVAIPVGLGQTWLIEKISSYLKNYPGVTIDWTLTDEPIDVINGDADIWIKIGKVADDRLIVRTVARVERFLVANPELASNCAHWETLPCVSLSPFYRNELSLFDQNNQETSHSPNVVFATNNIMAARQAVLNSIGYALLPDWLIKDDVKLGHLIRIAPHLSGEPLDVVLAYAPERGRPLRLKKFLEHFA